MLAKKITRTKEINKILAARQSGRVVLLTGLFGSGRSTLLEEVAHLLRDERPPVRIVRVNCSTFARDGEIPSGKDLMQEAHALGAGPSVLFLDEADLIGDIASAISKILEKFQTMIFVTGRHTADLERTLTGAFGKIPTGPLAIIRVGPISYGDFLEAWGLPESRDSFALYARSGGLPQSLMIDPRSPDAGDFTLLRANSFLLSEIIEPDAIRNPGHLRELLALCSRSCGESLPARQACAAFAARRMTISPQAVIDYLALCEASGLLVSVETVDLTNERRIDGANVWYFGDVGLRAAFSGRDSGADRARAEENLAYLKLVDDGWTVRHGRVGYGKHLRDDVTFACDRDGRRAYVQVIGGNATAAEHMRKTEALLAIRDAWPKYLVGDEAPDAMDGVTRLSPREFLTLGL
ncbi:MAG TPA: AAA family ATPase [Treponemataceae bacterium]|nr:AAA family ATPase [Treponemataceae bacterium]